MSENEHRPKPAVGERRSPDPPKRLKERHRSHLSTSRRAPFIQLALFYAGLIGIGILLVRYVPLVQHAWVASPMVEGTAPSRDALIQSARDTLNDRAWSILLITLGALAVSVPIAWVYTFTRRLRYDSSLVHSVIILPMVVSGIVVIVKDSIALAFSLAGIVAAVRFRNTLKDPKDAVYIFLSIGLGLAAGVQALDIALVLSIVFNTVVLVLWRYNFGAVYSETARGILAVGEPQLMIAGSAVRSDKIRARVAREARDIDVDGILIVHAYDSEAARQRIELTLGTIAEDWRITGNFRRRNGIGTFAAALRFKDKKGDPFTLLAEIDEQWGGEVAAAEYLPYKKAAEKDEVKDEQP